MLLAWKKNKAHVTNMLKKKKSSWEKLIFWVEVGKDVEVLLVNCFQSPTLIHDKIISLVHQIIDFIPDFFCGCTNLICGSVKWAYENLSRLNKFLVLVLLSPVNASMHVVIHTSLQSLSLVSLAKATCNVKLFSKLSSKLLDEMMKIAEYILCFSAEPSPGTSQMKTFRDTNLFHLYCISNYLKSILLAPTSHQDWVPSLQSLIKCHFKNFQVGLVSLVKGLAWLELIFSLLKQWMTCLPYLMEFFLS